LGTSLLKNGGPVRSRVEVKQSLALFAAVTAWKSSQSNCAQSPIIGAVSNKSSQSLTLELIPSFFGFARNADDGVVAYSSAISNRNDRELELNECFEPDRPPFVPWLLITFQNSVTERGNRLHAATTAFDEARIPVILPVHWVTEKPRPIGPVLPGKAIERLPSHPKTPLALVAIENKNLFVRQENRFEILLG
jgi:hypothetical protein